MPTPLDEPRKFSSFSLPSLLCLSQMCLCHKSSATTHFFVLWSIKYVGVGGWWQLAEGEDDVLISGMASVWSLWALVMARAAQEWRSGLSRRTYRSIHEG